MLHFAGMMDMKGAAGRLFLISHGRTDAKRN
jgi:hypothetical protein